MKLFSLSKKEFILFILFLQSLSGLSCLAFDSVINSYITLIVVFGILFTIFFGKGAIVSDNYCSRKWLVAFAVLPLFTHIVTALEYDQPYYESARVMLPHWLFLIYFILIKKEFNVEGIIKIILILAAAKVIITGAQQITYPNILFSFKVENTDDNGFFHTIPQRSGFYRFLLGDAYYLTLFSAIYCYTLLLKKFNRRIFLLFLLYAFGLYMDQTRQILVSFTICLILLPLLKTGSNKSRYILFTLLILGLLYGFSDELFGELMVETKEDSLEGTSRMIASSYFLDNTGGFFTSLFGHGFPYKNSSLGILIDQLNNLHITRCDVGMFGAIHMVGYAFVVTFLLYFLFVVKRNWKYIDDYLQLYLISIIINIPLIFPLYNYTVVGIEFFMGMLFWMVDKSIIANKNQ